MKAVDLFAGCGGFTLAAVQAGIKVLVAANHWGAAVECHTANHPDVKHLQQDLQQANFHDWPDFDLLCASPACQGHSRARGKEHLRHDASRSTAWAVVAAAEAKLPRYLAVENVPEFLRWQLYPQWRAALEQLGYRLSEQILDAADYGVPQNRRRAFVLGTRGDEVLTVRTQQQPPVPFRTILDVDASKWGRVDRPGRSPRVLEQVAWGRDRLGGTFLVPYYSSGSGRTARSLDRPIGTIRTHDCWALVDGDWMRMLTLRECKLAQDFPANYLLPRQHKLAVHLVGNAVPPTLARHVLHTFVEDAQVREKKRLVA